MIGFRCFDSALAKESRAKSVLARVKTQKLKKFKKVQRSSKKFTKVQQSSTKFNKVQQSSKFKKIQRPLPAREYLSGRHHATKKKQRSNTIYDFAVVAAGCSRAPQWKNVVFDISPNRR
jgi:hypothetical protein